MTSENEIGKKPTIINKNGINRSAISGVPKRLTKFCAAPAVTVMMMGKTSVSSVIGTTMRQSRNVSRNSRRVNNHTPRHHSLLDSETVNVLMIATQPVD